MTITDYDNYEKPERIKTALACHYSYSETTLICTAIGEKDEIKTLNVLSKLEIKDTSIQKIVGIIQGLNDELKFKKILRKRKDQNNFETIYINKHFALSQCLKSVYYETYVVETDFEVEDKIDDEPAKDLFLSLIAENSIIASEDIDINNVVSGTTLKAFKLLVKGLSKELIPGNKIPDYKLLMDIFSGMVTETEIRLNTLGW